MTPTVNIQPWPASQPFDTQVKLTIALERVEAPGDD